MLVVKHVSVRPLTVASAEIFWALVPTDEPLINARFRVLRSEAPDGPYVDISGPLVNTFHFVDHVNLKSKFDNVSWRIRVEDVQSGVTVDYPNGTPDESFTFHPLLDRVALLGDFGPDYIALEIVRNLNLLLRRFTGTLCAFLPARTMGPRCTLCYDKLKMKQKLSTCPECYGTSFQGGFYNPVNVFVDLNPPPSVVQISNFARSQVKNSVLLMANYPIAKPNDVIVDRANARWRIVQVNTVTEKRYVVQQVLGVEEIEKGDSEYLFPLDLSLKAPAEDFVGFYPQENSPRVVQAEGSGLL